MLTKQIKLKHGVSELGNLQVYPITEIIEDDKIISSTRGAAYTPKDPRNMASFDEKSKEIVQAITTKEVKDAFDSEKQKKTGKGIEKIITHDRIIEKSGCIAVRQITRIFDNGKELSKKYHRSWLNPGDDPAKHDVISKVLAQKLHTPKIVKAYKQRLANNQLPHANP